MLTINEVKEAQKRLDPYVYKTPLIRLRNLDSYLNCQVYVKAECMQLTNSFKMFDQNLALTAGGPGRSTSMLALDIFYTFKENC